MKHTIKEFSKNIIYSVALGVARSYWRIIKPVTYGARVLLVCGDHVLLVQSRKSHYWNFPGGGIKKKENPSEGALRELFEETGIKIKSSDYLLGEYCSKAEGRRDTVFIVVAHIDNKIIPRLEIEIQKAEWFSFSNLPEKITQPTLWRIHEYVAEKKDIKGIWTKE
jgi:8-oxo-dGTP pyrophosphatase MutT (NUDIX family)